MHARSCSGGKNVCRRGITIILTDSARKKKSRKEVLANYNKTKINAGHHLYRWMELEEALRVQSRAEVSLRM
jgi:hypothetical protein